MKFFRTLGGIAAVGVAITAAAPSATAQENTISFTCTIVGVGPTEPLGDREGHAVSQALYSCLASTGPLSGGVWTETIVWEWDKNNGVLVSGAGVVRKPGVIAVVQLTEQKLDRIVTDGKVTGAVGAGHGTFPVAVGPAVALSGKSFAYSVKTTGPNQFNLEMKLD
jgi:hypothetical protein